VMDATGLVTHTVQYKVIDEETFEKSIRHALKNLHDPDEFFGNPLLESSLVETTHHWLQRALALQQLLYATIATLEKHPKQARAYRALDKTFLHPEATQEQAAEMLDIPFSTYRRHLNEGIDYVVRTLWHRLNS
jgi:hypothetical protein